LLYLDKLILRKIYQQQANGALKIRGDAAVNISNSVNQQRRGLKFFWIIIVVGIVAIIAWVSGYLMGKGEEHGQTEPIETLVSAPLDRITVAGSMSSDLLAKTLTMIYIPAAEIMMGDEKGDIDEKPAHVVYVDGFYIDQYEVTNEFYAICVNEGVCREPESIGETNMSSKYYYDPQYAKYPINTVNWHMAKTYCEWRGARLPTEPEWELAARGTDGRLYPWGDEIDCSYANYRNCNRQPVEVGSYETGKSVYGVYDMAGNVWEWVADKFQHYPYVANYDGQVTEYDSRVVRGGGWKDDPQSLRSSNRSYLHPWLFYDYETVGFRCARDVDG